MAIKEVDGRIYYVKGDGRLIPEETIPEVEKLRDQLVEDIIARMAKVKEQMAVVRKEILDDISSFVDLSIEKYGVSLGGEVGNLTLSSYDNSKKLSITVASYITFNEKIEAAKKLIFDYLNDVTKGSSVDIKKIVTQAFSMEKGQIDVKAVIKLKDLDIQDPRWIKAMEIVNEAKVINYSPNKVLRAYVSMPGPDGKIKPMYQSMDFASL